MPFDAGGAFTRVHSWGYDRDQGIKIMADRHDEEDDNFAGGLSATFLRNGSVPMGGDLNLANHRLLGLSPGSAAAPGVTFQNDPNSGLFSPSAGQLGVTAGGTQVGLWTSAGLTVSGTFSAANLHATGTITADGDIHAANVFAAGGMQALALSSTGDMSVAGTATLNALTVTGPVNISQQGVKFHEYIIVEGADSANGNVVVKNTVANWAMGMLGALNWSRWSLYNNLNGSEVIQVPQSGYVGINVNPAERLDVNGTFLCRSHVYMLNGQKFNGIYSNEEFVSDGVHVPQYGFTYANPASIATDCVGHFSGWGGLRFHDHSFQRMELNHMNFRLFAETGGAKANVYKIRMPNDCSTTSDAANCKLFLYDDGGANRWGYGLGSNADMQYHAGYTGLNGRHDFFSGNNLRFRTNIDGIQLWGIINAVTGPSAAPDSAWASVFKNPSDGGLSMRFQNSIAELGVINCNVQAAGAGTDDGVFVFYTATNGALFERLRIGEGNMVVNDYMSNIVKNNDTGSLNISGGSSLGAGAGIVLRGSSQAGYGSRSEFYTSGAERMRIDPAGKVFIGSNNGDINSIIGSGNLRVCIDNTSTYGMCVSSQLGGMYAFQCVVNGGHVGGISCNGSSTAFNTSSDERIKENIVDSTLDTGPLIDAVQLRDFDFKTDGTHVSCGTIAQELYEIFPEAVSVPANEIIELTDHEGKATGEEMFIPWGVDYSKLVPVLIKELQSLRQRVAQLEAA